MGLRSDRTKFSQRINQIRFMFIGKEKKNRKLPSMTQPAQAVYFHAYYISEISKYLIIIMIINVYFQ